MATTNRRSCDSRQNSSSSDFLLLYLVSDIPLLIFNFHSIFLCHLYRSYGRACGCLNPYSRCLCCLLYLTSVFERSCGHNLLVLLSCDIAGGRDLFRSGNGLIIDAGLTGNPARRTGQNNS
jgi:hypothetical protein